MLRPSEIKAALKKLSTDTLDITRTLVDRMKEKAVERSGIDIAQKFKDAIIPIIFALTDEIDKQFDAFDCRN